MFKTVTTDGSIGGIKAFNLKRLLYEDLTEIYCQNIVAFESTKKLTENRSTTTSNRNLLYQKSIFMLSHVHLTD